MGEAGNVKILQTITVKQVLTEKSKEMLLQEYEQKLFQLKKECEQLRFELKKLERTKKYSTANLLSHFEKEMEFRQEKMKLIEFQTEQLHMLPLGSELKETEVQALVDIKLGDKWDKISNNPTIIIKDGIITEIRER